MQVLDALDGLLVELDGVRRIVEVQITPEHLVAAFARKHLRARTHVYISADHYEGMLFSPYCVSLVAYMHIN